MVRTECLFIVLSSFEPVKVARNGSIAGMQLVEGDHFESVCLVKQQSGVTGYHWVIAYTQRPPTLQKKIRKEPLPDFLLEGMGWVFTGYRVITKPNLPESNVRRNF